ncbi:unnamed protein product [Enterobius vermicularis]|uniref:Coiled-coil domain-containing protein 53 n=1 Tax=Enterobius vermicularis TaxID=51028 RepID=A0A0N4V6I3_ENTVE|nr:unnamed protein product [Enterobius vermicularis]
MDPDLSFITPDIKLDQVPPLDIKRVIAFVNHFVMRDVQLINSFAVNAERRVLEIENRIKKLTVELQLLEAKLDSIPSIQEAGTSKDTRSGEPVFSKTSETVGSGSVADPSLTLQLPSTDVITDSLSAEKMPEKSEPAAESEESRGKVENQLTKKIKAQDDPRYAKYFKMLRLGVLEAAVKQKMATDGIDPEILNNPNAEMEVLLVATGTELVGKGSSSSELDNSGSTYESSDNE